MAERGYVLLELDETGVAWTPVATVEAHSNVHAVTTYAAGIEESRTLRIVAVPLRSWKPVVLERRPEWTTRIAEA